MTLALAARPLVPAPRRPQAPRDNGSAGARLPIALRRSGLLRQAGRFVVVGAAATVAYLGLYVLLRAAAQAQLANLVAGVVTAVTSTEAHRRWTFAGGHRGFAQAQVQSGAVLAVNTALTSTSLTVLHAVVPTASASLELAVLLVAGAAGGTLRFLALRLWVFRRA